MTLIMTNNVDYFNSRNKNRILMKLHNKEDIVHIKRICDHLLIEKKFE